MAEAITGGAVDVIGAGPAACSARATPGAVAGRHRNREQHPTGLHRPGPRAAASESLWYTGQIWRMADGKDPDPHISMLAGLLRYAGATARDVAHQDRGPGIRRGCADRWALMTYTTSIRPASAAAVKGGHLRTSDDPVSSASRAPTSVLRARPGRVDRIGR